MNWAKMIRDARTRLGESQEVFARRFGVATNTVSRWETGTYDVSLAAVEWLLTYSEMKEIKTCPLCGGCGLVQQPTKEADSE